MNYLEQLIDDRWLSKAAKVKARDMHKCVNCEADKQLEVHHLYYLIDKKAWNYPDNALMTLCRKCHQKWHDMYEIEFRSKKWSKKTEYQPKFKTKKKYHKPRVIKITWEPSNELDKAKKRISKRVQKEGKFSFSPIPEWRQKKQVQ